jgi:hypothetical protein
MNGVIIITLASATFVFLIIQIRFIRRYIRIKRSYNHLPGVLFLAEAIGEGCFLCFDCCLWASGESDNVDILGGEHLEKYSGKPPEEYEVQLALEGKKKADRDSLSPEEEQTKVKNLVSERQKTSIMYISNITSLQKQRVIEILLADPDYIIEHEYVINKKLLPKEEKIPLESCPQCENPVKPNWEYCSNCGYDRN